MVDDPAPLTAEELADIRARLDAATDGPWECAKEVREYEGSVHYQVRTALPRPLHPWGARYLFWTNGALAHDLPRRARLDEVRDDAQAHADATFVAHARVDVGALLGEVARLRRVVARAWEQGWDAAREAAALVADEVAGGDEDDALAEPREVDAAVMASAREIASELRALGPAARAVDDPDAMRATLADVRRALWAARQLGDPRAARAAYARVTDARLLGYLRARGFAEVKAGLWRRPDARVGIDTSVRVPTAPPRAGWAREDLVGCAVHHLARIEDRSMAEVLADLLPPRGPWDDDATLPGHRFVAAGYIDERWERGEDGGEGEGASEATT